MLNKKRFFLLVTAVPGERSSNYGVTPLFDFHKRKRIPDPNKKLRSFYPTNLDKMSFLSSDLANLGLSLKTYTFLKQKGINKIGNLLEHSPQSLLQLLNRNREMFVEVKKCFW